MYRTSMGKWKRYERQLEPLRQALGGTIERYERELAEAMKRHEGDEGAEL